MPDLVLLDVNETLADLGAVRRRLEQAGAPGHLLPTWFAATLRDGFALTAVGEYAEFADVAAAVLRTVAPDVDAEHVLAGMSELEPQPDVADGLRALRDGGLRVATLSNGKAETAAGLLDRAGLGELVEAHLEAGAVRRWKPAAEAYLNACSELAVMPERTVLVAAHPWDCDGAKRAGLRSAWLNRAGTPWPDVFLAPDAEAPDFPTLASRIR